MYIDRIFIQYNCKSVCVATSYYKYKKTRNNEIYSNSIKNNIIDNNQNRRFVFKGTQWVIIFNFENLIYMKLYSLLI